MALALQLDPGRCYFRRQTPGHQMRWFNIEMVVLFKNSRHLTQTSRRNEESELNVLLHFLDCWIASSFCFFHRLVCSPRQYVLFFVFSVNCRATYSERLAYRDRVQHISNTHCPTFVIFCLFYIVCHAQTWSWDPTTSGPYYDCYPAVNSIRGKNIDGS